MTGIVANCIYRPLYYYFRILQWSWRNYGELLKKICIWLNGYLEGK